MQEGTRNLFAYLPRASGKKVILLFVQNLIFCFRHNTRMNYLIKAPHSFQGIVQLPASKSISNRVLIINQLSESSQPVRNLSDCDDTRVMLNALNTTNPEVDIQAAGTAMRFLTAYFASTPGQRVLTGTERMKKRPIQILVDALVALGAQIDYTGQPGFPPLRLNGKKLRGGEIELDGSVSSQFVSALLMVAPTMQQGLRLRLTGGLISKPYVQLTVELMKQFGVAVQQQGDTFVVIPQPYAPVPFTVESDWSAASYWYELVAFSNDAQIELPGLHANSLQGDAAIARLFEPLGVETVFTQTGVLLKRKQRALPELFKANFVDIPDMAQTFVVVCAQLGVPFLIEGLQSLQIKETNRLAALCAEMRKFGYLLTELNGCALAWNGNRTEPTPSPVVATYDDHRMALAFAPLACGNPNGVRIADPGVVSKSYPNFWDHLASVGFACMGEPRT